MEAFSEQKMSEDQAKWLMKFLKSAWEKKKKLQDGQTEDPTEAILTAIEEDRNTLEQISGTLEGCMNISGAEAKRTAEQMTGMIKDLSATVTKLRDDRKRMYKKLDELTK